MRHTHTTAHVCALPHFCSAGVYNRQVNREERGRERHIITSHTIHRASEGGDNSVSGYISQEDCPCLCVCVYGHVACSVEGTQARILCQAKRLYCAYKTGKRAKE